MFSQSGLIPVSPCAFLLLLLPSGLLVSCGEEGAKEATARQAPVDVPVSSPTPVSQFGKYVFETEEGKVDLGEGEYLVAMLSDSCEHCGETARDLNRLMEEMPDCPPVVGLCLGDEQTLEEFRTRADPRFPTFLIDTLEFFDLIGEAPPRIYLIRDGKDVEHWDDEVPLLETVVQAVCGEEGSL